MALERISADLCSLRGNFTIKRKDGAAFKFYGVKLNYTSASTSNDIKPLTVNYSASSGTIPSDEYTAANANITIAKSGGVDVTLVSTLFYHLATLVFDDLVVGPASGSPTTPAPSFTQNPTATAVCIGSNATFTATASNATSFQWQQDDNSGFSSPTNVSTGGIYTVSTSGTTSTLTIATNASVNGQYFRARATNSTGSTNSTGAQLTVNALPTPSITGLAAAYCKDASAVTLSGSPSGGSFTIDNNSATSLNPATLSVGAHSVVYTYTNGNGCTNTTSQQVTINALPTPSITGLATAYCQDATPVSLTGSPTGGVFTLDGTTATTLTPSSLSVGQHTVVYSYTNANGCSATANQPVTIKQTPTAPSLVTQSGHPYPAGVSSLTASQNTGDVVLVVSGCAGGTLSWSGGASSTLAVATTNTGVFTFTANCTNNGCTSPLATATIMVVAPTLTVSHLDATYGQFNTNTIKPYLQLNNIGGNVIPYNTITVRYWLTVEGNSPITNFQIYYVQLGATNVQVRYVPLAQALQGANGYVEYSFQGGAGNLNPTSNSGPIQNGFLKADYSAFNQADDYSFVTNRDYTLNPHITAYVNGQIFYGQEPTAPGSGPQTPLAVNLTATAPVFPISDNTTLVAQTSGGSGVYSYVFSGPGTITPNGNTAVASGQSAGVKTFTVVVTDPVPQQRCRPRPR